MNNLSIDLSNLSPINIDEILKIIPHRYPMLLVDRLYIVNQEEAIGIKNVTFNEEFFQGHFPGKPIMPGVLIIEAMAQAAGIFVMKKYNDQSISKSVYFMSIESARFRRPVVPGDVLYLHVKKLRHHAKVWKFKGAVHVNDKLVAEATYSAMIGELQEK